MDDVVNRLARELADSMTGAVADDPRVEACREKARAAGFEMRVSLEAVIGFVNRSTPRALPNVGTPIQSHRGTQWIGDYRKRPPLSALSADCRRRDKSEGGNSGSTELRAASPGRCRRPPAAGMDLAFAHPAAGFPPEWRRPAAEVSWEPRSDRATLPRESSRRRDGALASGKTSLNFNNLAGYRWFDLFQEVAYDSPDSP